MKREAIPVDYIWANGRTMSPLMLESYNALQARIAAFEVAGLPVPEYLLNGSHNLVSSFFINLPRE